MPTYRLETFGKLVLTGGTAAGQSQQRRRLALLALLASSGERGLSRDQLLGYLWPESSSTNARHSLEQLLHELRRSLGDSIFVGTNPLTLNDDVVSSDVKDFDRLLVSGDLGGAVTLYGGGFLEGFYLDGAPEFDRWADRERARLADRYTSALGRLATDAEKARDYPSAVKWRRREVDADPVSSRATLALMRALVASGDRTAALQHARIYESLIEQELQTAPDSSITDYANALRAGTERRENEEALHRVVSSEVETAGNASNGVVHAIGKSPHDDNLDTMAPRPAAIGNTTGHRSRYWIGAGTTIVVAAIAVMAAFSRTNRQPALDQNRIVILPFRVTGADSTLNYLREGVVDLLAPMLTGEGGPIAVDSRTSISTWNRVIAGREGTVDDARDVARQVGAGSALTGSLVEVDGSLTITGSVVSGNGGNPRPLTSVRGSVDSVDKLLRSFAGQLIARESGLSNAALSTVMSQSLPAIRAYLQGRAAYRRADEDAAMESFAGALDIDSTFALAALDLAVATGKLLRLEICRERTCRTYSVVPGFVASQHVDDLFDRGVRLAMASRSHLAPRDVPLLDALTGRNFPRASSARESLSGLGTAIRAAPDRAEAHYLLGTLLLYQGATLGVMNSSDAAVASFRRSLALDSGYLAPRARLVEVAAFNGDSANVRHYGLSYLERDRSGPTADYVRWMIAAASSDLAAQRAIRSKFSAMSRTTLDRIYLTAQISGFGIKDADSAARLLIDGAPDLLEKSVAYRRAEILAINRGRPLEAARALRNMESVRTTAATAPFAVADAIFNDGDKAAGDSAARELARTVAADTARTQTPDEIRRSSAGIAVLSMWYLQQGESTRALAAADWLRRHEKSQPRNRILSLLPEMVLSSRARRPESAAIRAHVDSAMLDGCCALPEFVNSSLVSAYEQGGDFNGALRAVRRAALYYPPRQLTHHLREEGRLAARLGDRAGAVRAYQHYLALRSDPEPALRAERDEVRTELGRLIRNR